MATLHSFAVTGPYCGFGSRAIEANEQYQASLTSRNRMNPQLENKRALVTGGGRGIGAAIVQRLAREGAHVALTYVSKPEQAEHSAAAARELGVKALALRADSADAGSLVAAVERAAREWGGLDILVHNAGIATLAPIEEFALADFDRTVAVNLRAVFVATQAALEHMPAGGR